MDHELVSIIIPVFNGQKFIAESIRSALKQTYKKFELIIVDDGSDDQTVEICSQFSDARLKLIACDRKEGVSAARNRGLEHSKGQYIAFLDSDDLWKPTFLEEHLAKFKSNSAIGLSFSWSEFIGPEGKRLKATQRGKVNDVTYGDILRNSPISNGSCIIIRRELLEEFEMEPFDSQLTEGGEDFQCWLNLSKLDRWQIGGVPKVLTYYRINYKGSLTQVKGHYQTIETVIKNQSVSNKEKREALANKSLYLWRLACFNGDIFFGLQLFLKALTFSPLTVLAQPHRIIFLLLLSISGLFPIKKLRRVYCETLLKCGGLLQSLFMEKSRS